MLTQTRLGELDVSIGSGCPSQSLSFKLAMSPPSSSMVLRASLRELSVHPGGQLGPDGQTHTQLDAPGLGGRSTDHASSSLPASQACCAGATHTVSHTSQLPS